MLCSMLHVVQYSAACCLLIQCVYSMGCSDRGNLFTGHTVQPLAGVKVLTVTYDL